MASDKPVWIEDGDGTIVRGTAEFLTAGGLQVRLAGLPRFRTGAGVALRISLDPESPTVAATARVRWVRSDGGEAECALEWTSLGSSLEEWLASRN
jgi:hypothetical protein